MQQSFDLSPWSGLTIDTSLPGEKEQQDHARTKPRMPFQDGIRQGVEPAPQRMRLVHWSVRVVWPEILFNERRRASFLHISTRHKMFD